jgi:hypothetical protein
MSKITINGVTYQGNNVTVVNDQVIIDGNKITYGASKEPIKVFVEGNVETLDCHNAQITGDVYGDVDAHNVTCDTIGGDVDAHTVTCEYIKGKVDAHTVKTLKKPKTVK